MGGDAERERRDAEQHLLKIYPHLHLHPRVTQQREVCREEKYGGEKLRERE